MNGVQVNLKKSTDGKKKCLDVLYQLEPIIRDDAHIPDPSLFPYIHPFLHHVHPHLVSYTWGHRVSTYYTALEICPSVSPLKEAESKVTYVEEDAYPYPILVPLLFTTIFTTMVVHHPYLAHDLKPVVETYDLCPPSYAETSRFIKN